jgi:hypothetical protein
MLEGSAFVARRCYGSFAPSPMGAAHPIVQGGEKVGQWSGGVMLLRAA